MKVSLFYLPSIGSRAEIERGMAGLREDLYGRMLGDISAQAKLADDLGYDSVSFTEHHFHVEGFELSNNPVLLDLFVGMQTKHIRVGQLGIVLPAQNPIRVAEDIAMLDHMTGGRACAGFARGYQRRWVDVMAQQMHGIHGALPHEHDEIDAANRAAFEECFRIVKAAWTGEMLEVDGRYWRVPPGETPWDLEATRLWGRGVEQGIVRSVGVVPKPLQKPHPPLFQPFASSERSIRWCAAEGVTAVLPALHPKTELELCRIYAEVSGLPLGEGMGVLRDLILADTDEEAQALWQDSGYFCGSQWFAPFGFFKGLADPETGEDAHLFEQSLVLVGSADTVTRQLERLMKR
ncbi:MAG: LLM class flavin-dependent oxidoreductase, partial [Candidatus Binatia bacterium]